jgi:coenzyme PQQ biosynthesis enzyme PqqE
MSAIEPPLALLAELTHRCPLRCPYCSNPTELARAKDELTTAEWARVFREAAALGCLQLHLSGGEPTARRDIVEITAAAREAGLYSNLITAGVLLNAALMARLVEAGLDHVQLSVQDADEAGAERIGGMRGAHDKKRAAAALVKQAGLPLTLNAVVHRQNLHNLSQLIDIALEWGAQRLEVAHVQYYGWALANRDALLPTRAQLDVATRIVDEARLGHRGRLVIDYVVPDYHAARPKACMGGWGRASSPSRRWARCCPATPRNPSPDALPEHPRHLARSGLDRQRRLQRLPRHGLDAQALPGLRPCRTRLGRLPLPGLRADGRRDSFLTPVCDRPPTIARSWRRWRPAKGRHRNWSIVASGRGLFQPKRSKAGERIPRTPSFLFANFFGGVAVAASAFFGPRRGRAGGL